MSAFVALAVFSSLSLNLMIQLGIGIDDFGREPERSTRFIFFQWAALFCSVLVLWCLFAYVLSPLSLGFLEYFALFPLTAWAGKGIAALFRRLFPGEAPLEQAPLEQVPLEQVPLEQAPLEQVPAGAMGSRLFSIMSAHNGLTLTALVLSLRLAGSFSAALALSLGFSLGGLLSVFSLRAIIRRASLEAVPKTLRGIPLLLISMSLMALIFSALSVVFLQVLGGF
ncbi:hypothetical protein AGMMS50267_00120 [Spirochaetia bacterium]|nr:hypothetical protein AGMMS50267_00120 [Spirochaetia bacterium]